MKINFYSIVIILILLLSLVVRLVRLEYPLIHTSKWGDGTRDFLVAHYIKEYKEYPFLGPFNLLFDSGLRSSPIFYYVLAGFLYIKDDLMFLSLVNVFLQIGTIALIYFISRKIFGNPTAAVSSLLFSITPEILRQTEFMWQPYLMQFFAYLGLLLLTLSYYKKSYKFFLISFITITFASALHHSVLPWMPAFFLVAFVTVKNQKNPTKYYLGLIFTSLATFFILYFPLYLYFLDSNQNINSPHSSQIYVHSLKNYLENLKFNIVQVLNVFSLNWQIVIYIILGMVYLFTQSQKKKLIFLVGLFLFSIPILTSSLFNKNQLHYLTVSFGIFVILISEIITSIAKNQTFKIRGRNISLLLSIILITFTLKTFSADFYFLSNKREHSEERALIDEATQSMKNELQDFNSFQIVSYAKRGVFFRYPTLDTIFLVPLEKELKIKLMKIDDNSPYNLVQINKEDTIFVTCFEFDHPTQISSCINIFFENYPNYSIVKNVYFRYPVSIYSAKRH